MSSFGISVSASRVGMVVVAGSTVKRGDKSPVEQCSINDTSEKPLSSRRWDWQNCSFHSSSPSKEKDLDFMFPLSPTSAARFGWRRCLLLTGAFACSSCGSRQEPQHRHGAAASTLPTTHPKTAAESCFHIGNVTVRRQDTSRARVQVTTHL